MLMYRTRRKNPLVNKVFFLIFSDGSEESLRPVCECGAHIAFSRSRMGMLSDPHRRDVFISCLKQVT